MALFADGGADPMDQFQGVFEKLANGDDGAQNLQSELGRKGKRGTGSEVRARPIPAGAGAYGFTDTEGEDDAGVEAFMAAYGGAGSETEIAAKMMEDLHLKQGMASSRNNGAPPKKAKRTREEIATAAAEKREREAEEKERKRLEREAAKAEKATAPKAKAARPAPKSSVKPDHSHPDGGDNPGILARVWSAAGSLGIGDGRPLVKRNPTENEAKYKAALLHKVRGYGKLVRKYRNDSFDPGDASAADAVSEKSSVKQLEQALEALQFEMNRIDPRPWVEGGMVKFAEFCERVSISNPKLRKTADLRGLTALTIREIEEKNFDEELDELAVMYSDRCVATLPVRFTLKFAAMAASMHASNTGVDIAMSRYTGLQRPQDQNE